MDKCCREMHLDEYIQSLEIDQDLKKRMLELYRQKEKEKEELTGFLGNCHYRIADLENTVVELSVELVKSKKYIREEMRKE